MKAMALVIDERGAALELGNHGVVVVRHHDGRCDRVGLGALSNVVLCGDVALSTALLRALAANGIALACVPIRGLTPAAGFAQLPWRMGALRHTQHLAYASPKARLAIARRVVVAKLASMFHQDEHARQRFEGFASQASRCATVAALMGVEGAATQAYYLELATRVSHPYSFRGRVRRPPRDPFNAMMSYTCALAQAVAGQLVARYGLDLQLGFLHGLQRNRPSLALDLIEPARAAVDDWLIELMCRRGELVPEFFVENEADGCRLVKEGRGVFFRLWFAEGLLRTLRPMRALLAVMLTDLRALQAGEASASAEPDGG